MVWFVFVRSGISLYWGSLYQGFRNAGVRYIGGGFLVWAFGLCSLYRGVCYSGVCYIRDFVMSGFCSVLLFSFFYSNFGQAEEHRS